MKKKCWLYLILPVVTLVLEILPYGAVCNFASAEGDVRRETYSYFSLIPYGYANFAPLLTAVITCIGIVLLIVYCVTGRPRIVKNAKILFCLGTVLSFCPLILGVECFSVVGALISVSLLAECILLFVTTKAQ